MITTILAVTCLVLGLAAVAVMGLAWQEQQKVEQQEHWLERDRKRLEAQQRAARSHWLVGKSGEVAGKRFHLGPKRITIGRRLTNHVQLQDIGASRVHCRLTPQRGGIWVEDLKSRNGISVNGRPVIASVLKDGDELQICNAIFIYKVANKPE